MCIFAVTPLAGVWIEINLFEQNDDDVIVTPLAGVWIEMDLKKRKEKLIMSLPLRECGLK